MMDFFEVYYVSALEAEQNTAYGETALHGAPTEEGWYFLIPDNEDVPLGPYGSRREAEKERAEIKKMIRERDEHYYLTITEKKK